MGNAHDQLADLSPRRRAAGTDVVQALISDFLTSSTYILRSAEPGICYFTFGNPHEMPPAEYVDALREALEPKNSTTSS